MLPRIAIPLPTSADYEYNRLNWPAFARAVAESGGEPVECGLQLDEHALSHLAQTCHGFLLPGSPADVDPASYGQVREPASAPADHARERVDRFLLEHAEHYGKVVLGVCFGAQMLNVFHGGTLVQDLMVVPVNHSASRSVFVAHSVAVAQGTLLSECVSATEAPLENGCPRLPVNSSHHQAIGIAGQALRVTARCPQDGVIEAIELTQTPLPAGLPFVVGVQWHPERTFETSATSRALFSRLTAGASAWLERQSS